MNSHLQIRDQDSLKDSLILPDKITFVIFAIFSYAEVSLPLGSAR